MQSLIDYLRHPANFPGPSTIQGNGKPTDRVIAWWYSGQTVEDGESPWLFDIMYRDVCHWVDMGNFW